jgi:hypothetical protein
MARLLCQGQSLVFLLMQRFLLLGTTRSGALLSRQKGQGGPRFSERRLGARWYVVVPLSHKLLLCSGWVRGSVCMAIAALRVLDPDALYE